MRPDRFSCSVLEYPGDSAETGLIKLCWASARLAPSSPGPGKLTAAGVAPIDGSEFDELVPTAAAGP